MATFSSRYIFFSTSPRNPRLIQGILKVILDGGLDGKAYTRALQAQFYNLYSESDVGVKGANSSKSPDLSGRDKLTRAPQSLGFLQTQTRKPLQITAAGKQLLNNDLFEDVLMHQMLKFQLPSPLHHETAQNKGRFYIKPFLEILRLINILQYLTYDELTIFGMSMTDYRNFQVTVDAIRQYRRDRESTRGKKSLKKLSDDTKYAHYRAIYADMITAGNIATRESKTTSESQFMKKKLANLSDYTDAVFRSLRQSGLIVMSAGRTLSISPVRQREVSYILTQIERKPMPEDMARSQFDKYMFNPELPILLNDNRASLQSDIVSFKPSTSIDRDLDGMNTYELKSVLAKLRRRQREDRVTAQAKRLKERRDEDIQNILAVFKHISDKEEGRDGPLMFEWNMWRAITMIDHGDIKGNFVPDDNGMPISTAGGGQGDIVGNYGDFQMIVEVTLSTGKRQYDMESEPVTRHVGEVQSKSDKPVFGMFVAQNLTPTVVNYFWTTNFLNHKVYNGSVDIIPMNLATFVVFFKAASHKVLDASDLLSIHQYSTKIARKTALAGQTEDDWHSKVLDYVQEVAGVE
ncbi:AlwI family type II restriction endonuclease [Lacticaseibacillus sp. GG6-2]